MGLDARDTRDDAPFDLYSHRLEELQRSQAVQQRRERFLGYSKLAIAFGAAIAAALLIYHPAAVSLLLALVAVFAVLAILQERVIRELRVTSRAVVFYERGLGRLTGGWEGAGETGEQFLDPMHPYARDLDIFGRASLFELLCTARTRAGEEPSRPGSPRTRLPRRSPSPSVPSSMGSPWRLASRPGS